MNRYQKAAVLARLVNELRQRGSWAGETHLQKATYLLQEAAGVPLDYEFVLYKHGPFAFDLSRELDDLNSDGLMVMEPQPYPYGPKLTVTDLGQKNLNLRDETVTQYADAIAKVVHFVGAKGVTWLERVATAYLLHLVEPDASDEAVADRLIQAKPHVSKFDALSAVKELRAALPELVGTKK